MTRRLETAAQLDSAIDSLLEGSPAASLSGEGELMATARLLRGALPRIHPRFGFEELLAARLSAAGRATRAGAAAHAAKLPQPVPLRPAETLVAGTPESAYHAAARRRLLAGGAIASGVSLALPIAGAALVAWRRSRSSGGPF